MTTYVLCGVVAVGRWTCICWSHVRFPVGPLLRNIGQLSLASPSARGAGAESDVYDCLALLASIVVNIIAPSSFQ